MTSSSVGRASVLLLVLAACACQATAVAPRPTALEPSWGDPAAATPVVVHGEQFPVKASQSLGGTSGDVVDVTYRAWLDEVELQQVRWIDAHTLEAVVPAGLGPGNHALTVENALGRRGSLRDAFFAGLPPASLTQSAALSSTHLATGQALTLTLTVVNVGAGPAAAVLPVVTPSLAGALRLDGSPAALDLAPGAGADFIFAFTALAPATVSLGVDTAGTSASGTTAAAAHLEAGPVVIQDPAALVATLALPSSLTTGDFAVTMVVTNTGPTAATGVQASDLSLTATSTGAVLLKGSPGSVATLAPGDQATFTWAYAPLSSGTLQFQGSASGTDAASGTLVSSATAQSNVATCSIGEVELLASDPLGDGTQVAQLAGYQGALVVGPRRSGAGAARLAPDGSGRLDLSFTLPADVNLAGTTSANTWPGGPPYPSLGAAGCAAGTSTCGPDDEDGRGLFTAGQIDDREWLFAGGARASGGLAYLYMTRDTGIAPAFRYVDLSRALGAEATALTGLGILNDVPYLGIQGTGRPFLLALRSMPPSAGLDGAPGSDLVDLRLDRMPGLGSAGTPANLAAQLVVDSVSTFAGRLYVANNGGWIRTTTDSPGDYLSNPGDWSPCTPSAPGYAALTSSTTSKSTDLEPADRAVPRTATWNGRLYVARNTTSGPQVWSCDPSATGSNSHCDPGDWSLLAPNTTGSTLLTQFDDPANAQVTLLESTPGYLYVGFNNAAEGIRLFRSSASRPRTAADFQGMGGCVAGQAGCAGVGGDGFGQPAVNTRIFDAHALRFQGTTQLYLITGDGVAPARVYRTEN